MAWQVQVFLFVASLMLSSMLRKDPRSGAPATLDDLQIPTAEDGKIIPVLFGTREISSYNMVWHGDLRTDDYKQRDPEYRRPQSRTKRYRFWQAQREEQLGL